MKKIIETVNGNIKVKTPSFYCLDLRKEKGFSFYVAIGNEFLLYLSFWDSQDPSFFKWKIKNGCQFHEQIHEILTKGKQIKSFEFYEKMTEYSNWFLNQFEDIVLKGGDNVV